MDGIGSLTVGGEAVITNDVFTAKTITTPLGNELKITGYDAATGVVTSRTRCRTTRRIRQAAGNERPVRGLCSGADGQGWRSGQQPVVGDESWTMCRRRWMMWTAWRRGRRQPATGNVLTGVDVAGGNDRTPRTVRRTRREPMA